MWVVQLAGSLSGKAMAAYTNLTREKSGDYEKVKAAILQRYEVKEETHQRKFSQKQKHSDESHREFVYRLQDCLQRWAKSQLTWEQMILIEQVYSSLPQDLAVWLQERKLQSVQQLADLADDYSLARHCAGDTTPMKEAVSSPGSNKSRKVAN